MGICGRCDKGHRRTRLHIWPGISSFSELFSAAPMREYLVEAAPLTGSNAAKQWMAESFAGFQTGACLGARLPARHLA
jgi:hypothetical protein